MTDETKTCERKKGKILVIEDSIDVREVIGAILELEGYEILFAENGEIAMRILHSGENPNLILLDLRMPVLDGEHFLRLFREENPNHIPVVTMSAGKPPVEVIAECDEFLAKPMDLETLCQTVKRYA